MGNGAVYVTIHNDGRTGDALNADRVVVDLTFERGGTLRVEAAVR
jgi:hypothetical protein